MAIKIILDEPERLCALMANGRYTLSAAARHGLNTGLSGGFNIVPIIVGSSVTAVRLSNLLLEAGISANPIVFPAVEDKQARLRIFLSSEHSHAQIEQAMTVIAGHLRAQTEAPSSMP